MADKKISELPTDSEAPAADDVIPFVDTSAGRSERMTVAELAASSAFTDDFAPKANPTFTGNVVVPDGDASGEAVNKGQLDALESSLPGHYAPLVDAFFLPADGRWVAISGTPAADSIGASTNGIPAWLLDGAAVDTISTAFMLPSHWLTFDVEVWWANTTTNVGDVDFVIRLGNIGDGETPASGTVGSATVNAPTTVNQMSQDVIASGVSASSARELTQLAVRRVGTADTLNDDVALVGVYLTQSS